MPARDYPGRDTVRGSLTPPVDDDDDDLGPDVEAQERDHDPEGDPDALDPGDCEPYAEDDPPPPAVLPDALDVELDEGDDLGDLDLCAPDDEDEGAENGS